MVALVIAFPVMVTGLLDTENKVDPSTVKIEIAPPADVDDDAPPPSFGPAPARQ